MNSNSTVISSGLALINDYSSDDSTNEEDTLTDVNPAKEKLPLPASIFNHNQQNSEELIDDPSAHDGRIRSFPHQRGNWATYIFIPFEVTDLYRSFVDLIIANSDGSVELKAVEDPHISVTQTVVLLHHWIDSFVKTVEQQLKRIASFDILFGSMSVYTNQEKTRTFIGLDVTHGSQELLAIVNVLDSCLKEFNLATFYDVPSFHVSFAWCLGDKKKILEDSLPLLETYFHQFASAHPEFRHLYVTKCCCKTGNKHFNFKLKNL